MRLASLYDPVSPPRVSWQLRNSTDGAGSLRFRVPAGGRPATLHVLLASNYLGDRPGAVPYRLVVASPDGERRPSAEVPPYSARPLLPGAAAPTPGAAGGGVAVGASDVPTRMLCLDGGGSKGVIPLEMLAELERRSGLVPCCTLVGAPCRGPFIAPFSLDTRTCP